MYLVPVRVLPTSALLPGTVRTVVSESALTHYEYAERYVRQHATRVFLSYGLPPGGRYACGVARQRRAVAHAPARAVRSPQQADFATPPGCCTLPKARN